MECLEAHIATSGVVEHGSRAFRLPAYRLAMTMRGVRGISSCAPSPSTRHAVGSHDVGSEGGVMAARPGSGFLKLSLVSMPVKAYTATDSGGEVHFNQLRARLLGIRLLKNVMHHPAPRQALE